MYYYVLGCGNIVGVMGIDGHRRLSLRLFVKLIEILPIRNELTRS
jgi:hypothetical protein